MTENSRLPSGSRPERTCWKRFSRAPHWQRRRLRLFQPSWSVASQLAGEELGCGSLLWTGPQANIALNQPSWRTEAERGRATEKQPQPYLSYTTSSGRRPGATAESRARPDGPGAAPTARLFPPLPLTGSRGPSPRHHATRWMVSGRTREALVCRKAAKCRSHGLNFEGPS